MCILAAWFYTGGKRPYGYAGLGELFVFVFFGIVATAGTTFVLEPQLRFAGQPGEQWTMFFRDPSGNPIEVKGFESLQTIYDT